MDKNCPMRHENGNCLPAGGFCTANKNICEALLNAYGMGKAQLSQEGTTKGTTFSCSHENDTISRQAAIEALWKALYEYEDKTEKQFQELKDLDVEDWIGHRFFVQNMNDIDRQTILKLPTIQPVATDTNVGDSISRQAAIEEVYERAIGNISWADRDDCKKLLEELPSVQPERKTGHWIAPKYYPTQFTFTCSECGYKQSFNGKFKFCPNCGAKMGEKQYE